MNNMQFDEATQTYRGTFGSYRWNGQELGQTFTGANKPLQITPEWIVPSYRDVFTGYWQDPLHNDFVRAFGGDDSVVEGDEGDFVHASGAWDINRQGWHRRTAVNLMMPCTQYISARTQNHSQRWSAVHA